MPVPITRNNCIDAANPSVARYLERLAGFRARRLRLSADPAGSEFGSFVRSAREAAESALFSGVRPTRPSVRRAGVAVSKDLRVERLYLTTEADYEVPLIVTAPAEGGGPLPAVICLHGTGQSKEGLLAEYGETLARRGYIVVVPDIRTFGEREDDYVFRAEVEILEGRSLWGLMVWDTLRIADYLRTRPDVDPERLGIVGHSLGGHTAQAAGSLDDGIAAAVASCGIFSYERFYSPRGHSTFNNPYVCVPGILASGDIYDLYAAQAPRPLMIAWAARDPLVPKEAIDDFLEFGEPLWTGLGNAEALTVVREDVEHQFTPSMRSQAFEWFDRWLGPHS